MLEDREKELRQQEKKWESENDLIKLKYNELEKLNHELETTNLLNEKRYQSLVDELKEKYKSQCMSLESRLKAELERFKILASKAK